MTDIAITWDNLTGYGDWSFSAGDLTHSTGIGDLENAVALSLFTDARCPDDFIPWDGDRRGWWGDTFTATPLGSTLWMLERAKKVGNTQLLLQARDACRDALQWMIDNGIVDTVKVSTRWASATAIGISITITEPLQSNSKTFRYSYAWA